MKLANAFLCINCEEVFETARNGCPSCGSKIIYSIARWFIHKTIMAEIEAKINEIKAEEE